MSEKGNFLIFCIEQYKNAKNISGKQTMELFKKHKVMEYIMECFDALHTTGNNYIVEDIDLYIESRKSA